MAKSSGKRNGGGLGRTGRDNGLTLRGKPKSKPKVSGKTGSAKGTGKGTSDKRRKTGKR